MTTLASLACGLSQDPASLIGARVVQGVAAGTFYPAVAATIQRHFSGAQRSRAFGYFGGVVGISAAAGPLLGGLLIQFAGMHDGWRWVFLVNVFIGAAAIPAAIRLLRRRPQAERHRLDPVGNALLAGTLLLLLIPLVEGRALSWPRWSWLTLAACVPAAALLWGWETRLARRGGEPVIQVELFRLRSFAVGQSLALLYFAGFSTLFFILSILWQQGLGRGALETGLLVLPMALASLLTASNSHRFSTRFGRRAIQAGICGMLAGQALTLLTIHLGAPPAERVAAGRPAGAGGPGERACHRAQPGLRTGLGAARAGRHRGRRADGRAATGRGDRHRPGRHRAVRQRPGQRRQGHAIAGGQRAVGDGGEPGLHPRRAAVLAWPAGHARRGTGRGERVISPARRPRREVMTHEHGFPAPPLPADRRYVSVYLEMSPDGENAPAETGLRWRAARDRLAGSGADPATLNAAEAAISNWAEAAPSRAVIARAGAVAMTVALATPPRREIARLAPLPHVMPMLAQRRPAIPHVRVAASRAGGEIVTVGGDGRARPARADGERLRGRGAAGMGRRLAGHRASRRGDCPDGHHHRRRAVLPAGGPGHRRRAGRMRRHRHPRDGICATLRYPLESRQG